MDAGAFGIAETAQRLESSLAGLAFAVSLVTPRWRGRQSPFRVPAGEPAPWGVTTQLAHLAVYEERLAAPVIAALAAGADGMAVAPSGQEDWFTAETETLSAAPVEEIVERLRRARAQQIAAVQAFTEATFNAPRTPLWGSAWGGRQCAGWVATKTVQHTWEHGNTIFQIALFATR